MNLTLTLLVLVLIGLLCLELLRWYWNYKDGAAEKSREIKTK